jgi:hypothetical protein
MNYANYDIIDSPVGIIDAWYILLQATFTPRHGGMPKHISPHYTHHYRAAPSTKERREQGGQGDHAPPPPQCFHMEVKVAVLNAISQSYN